MEVGIGLIGGGFLLATIIVTWLNRGAITALEDEQVRLRAQLRKLTAIIEERATATDAPRAEANAPAAAAPVVEPALRLSDEDIAPVMQTTAQEEPAPAAARHDERAVSFEQQFGLRLPIWAGGFALILTGFFLVKYSIEMGWLSPGVRVVLGLIFGGGLLGAARWVRQRGIASGQRIAQALAGAGIADLYICIYAACMLYDLVPAWLGFGGMALVTAGAVFLAMEQGPPIALLGLMGGFFTPALVSTGHPSAPLLFAYLYLLLAGFIFVIRQRDWWLLAIPTVLGAFLWAAIWLFGGMFAPGDSLWVGLFLIASCATVVAANHREVAEQAAHEPVLAFGKRALTLQYGTMGGALVLLSLLTGEAAFTDLEWGLFGLLSVGGIALAFFNQALYGLVPWLALVANSFLLLVWHTDDAGRYGLTLALFAALFAGSGYALQARSDRPLLWSGLLTASGLGYFLIAYFKLRHAPALVEVPLLWGGLALALAAGAVELLRRLTLQIPSGHAQRAGVLSLYAATATGFIAIALTIELQREFLSVAFSLQMLALAALAQRFALPALRWLTGVMGLCFGALLVPQILLLVQLTAYSLVEAKLALQASVPLVQWPLFQLGAPALCFAIGSLLLRQGRDDRLVRSMEVSAIILIGVMGYYLSRHAFHPNDNILFVKAGFGERGFITTALFLYGLGCVALGRRLGRGSIGTSGLVLMGMAAFRVLYFDCLRYNPLWAEQDVGSWPIFNRLWLPYTLPVVWLGLLLRLLPAEERFARLRPALKGAMLGLLFVSVTLQVRQLYHGQFLQQGVTSNAEIYTYSAGWLVLGLALLGFGTVRREKLLRVASLIVMLLTVGKVFLYDASALEGLYRVFSFLGLGLSLLGLSWFYARFVFGSQKERA
ncbi:MAG: DUF2339 domain-containing protein [Alphaproteobacteria bacterium]|nr:DUF2339 domain-containing protein [Alphaproteobacteria bacterium]